ncbi:hypothetical protein H0902_05300 [Microcystis aeruginosa BLCCF108]|uniref:Ribosomal-protein-S18p-alanine acetyltransferase n=2 Tax=Microcystis TaxID=1125 RepID=A0A841UHM6_MICAE|nr:Ribosomal-protein-S18p-alanine acetyltransferase [Microcystis panniformis FACHB-1757]MBC1190262.1 hypothetical protein [Microcystis aeruginosa BLCC-F108]
MGRWGGGEVGKWGSGEMGKWGSGEVGKLFSYTLDVHNLRFIKLLKS